MFSWPSCTCYSYSKGLFVRGELSLICLTLEILGMTITPILSQHCSIYTCPLLSDKENVMRVFHKMITQLYDLIFKQILNEMYEDQSEARNL